MKGLAMRNIAQLLSCYWSALVFSESCDFAVQVWCMNVCCLYQPLSSSLHSLKIFHVAMHWKGIEPATDRMSHPLELVV